MMRTACALMVLALALLLAVVLRPTGSTAIGFTFVACPTAALAVVLALIQVRRARAPNGPSHRAATPGGSGRP